MTFLKTLFRSDKNSDEEFTALVTPHVEPLYRMAFRWTQNPQDAEDLVQDVLIKVVNRLDELKRVDKLRPWLTKVLYHRFVDLYRQHPADRDTLPLDETHLTALENTTDDSEVLMLQQQLNRALLTLDVAHRDVVFMHDVEGYTALEVAEILNINVGTVKSRLHRARKKLKQHLQKEPFTPVLRVIE